MKKILLIAVLACASIAMWAQTYTVTGTVNAEANGKTVYLTVMSGQNNGESDKLDSAVVSNGQFTLKHSLTEPAVGLVLIERKGANVVLEQADITVAVNYGEKVSLECNSTKANVAFGQFNKVRNDYSDALAPLRKQMYAEGASKETIDSLRGEWYKLQDQYMAGMNDVCKNNSDNYTGLYFLQQVYSNWPLTEVSDYLAKVPTDLHSTKIYKSVKGIVDTKINTAEGKMYTDIKGATPEGKEIKLSDYVGKNKLVLIDFWASWCGPCMMELPNVIKAYETYHSKGLEILGVSLDSKADAWTGAIKEKNMTWPQISDLKGWKCEPAAAYGVRAIPATVLIGQDGTILKRDLRDKELLDTLEQLLK